MPMPRAGHKKTSHALLKNSHGTDSGAVQVGSYFYLAVPGHATGAARRLE